MKETLMVLHASMLSFAGLIAAAASLPGPEGICTPRKPDFAHAPGSPFAVGPMAGRPVVADMNADGKLDIVLACGTCCGSRAMDNSGHVVVFLNKGDATFEESASKRLKVGPSVRKIAVADVNSDNVPDVLAAEHDTYNVTVLINDSKGVLKIAGSFAAASGPRAHTHDIAAADLNADGNIDAITTNANDNTISVLLGDGRGSFAPAPGSPFATGRHPYDAIGVADFNADKRPDVAVPLLAGNKVGVLFNDASGALVEGPKMQVGERPGCLAIGDVNADGKPDLVSTHDDHGIVDVFLGDAAGAFRLAPGSPTKFATPVWGVAIADVNADKHADLVLGGAIDSDIVIALGDGTGKFAESASIKVKADTQPNYVAVADLNADGKPDIVSGNYRAGTVAVLLGR